MIRYRNKNWELTVTRNMSLFQSCMDVAGHYLFSKKFSLPAYEHIFVVKNGSIMFAYHSKKNSDRYHKAIEEICLNRAKFRKLKTVYKKYGNDLWRASEKLEKKAGVGEYKNYVKANLNLSAGLYLTTAIGKLIHGLLIDELKLLFPSFSHSEIEMLVSEVTYPDRLTPLSQSRIDLLDLCIYLQKNKIDPKNIEKLSKVSNIFEKYYRKYHFIPVNFNEDPWTRADIMNQLLAKSKNDCKNEKEAILRSNRKKIKIAKRKLKEIGNSEITQMAKVLQSATILNEYRKYIFCRASLAYRPLFKKIASENKMTDWRECWRLTPEEIFELHFKKNKEIAQAIKGRDWTGITYIVGMPGYKIFSKKEVKPFVDEIVEIKDENKIIASSEIKGTIANRGNVTGKARIILEKKDFHKFKEQDIIVTAMTSVDFIPLMERASAFVTNEGGITSHASIVSRELNKPCIIGTKIATKVLHDGDLIEVDADNGVVKILK